MIRKNKTKRDLLTFNLSICFGITNALFFLVGIFIYGVDFKLMLSLLASIFTTSNIWLNSKKHK